MNQLKNRKNTLRYTKNIRNLVKIYFTYKKGKLVSSVNLY